MARVSNPVHQINSNSNSEVSIEKRYVGFGLKTYTGSDLISAPLGLI